MKTTSKTKLLHDLGVVAQVLTGCVSIAACGGPLVEEVELSEPRRAGLSCALKQEATGDGEIVIAMEIRNHYEFPVRIMPGDIPSDSRQLRSFRSFKDGEELPFLGTRALYPRPSEEDLVSIEPGAAVVGRRTISRDFSFDQTGVYRVQWSRKYFGVTYGSLEELHVEPAECGVSSVVIDTPRRDLRFDRASRPISTFDECSASQIAAVLSIEERARTASRWALTYFSTLSAQYTRWFGTYGNPTLVNSGIVSVHDPLWADPLGEGISGGYDYECETSCDGQVAYVNYPFTDVIHFCPDFFTMPPTLDNDSQLGTYIHEMSHWFANKDDNAYGYETCLSLAITNPESAAGNADSYGYYVNEIHRLGVAARAAALVTEL